jgi:hypothetical protein
VNDELTLLRRFAEVVPEPDTSQLGRARCILLEAVQDEIRQATVRPRRARPPFKPTRIMVGSAAAFVLIVAAASVLLGGAQTTTHHPFAPRWGLVGDIEQPAWQVQGNTGTDAFSLVCPTASDCYATAPSSTTATNPSGIVEVSNDGGKTWHSSLVAGAGSDLSGLTCPSSSTCLVTSEDFESGSMGVHLFVTQDGGATWSSQALPANSDGSSLLACGSAQQCVVTASSPGPGGQGIAESAVVTEDGGAHWTTVPFPGTFRPLALSCVPDGHCVAVGPSPSSARVDSGSNLHGSASALFSDDGGLTWQMGTLPVADMVEALSCADAEHCMAIEITRTVAGSASFVSGPEIDTFISTDNGGRTWKATTGNEPQHWLLGAVSCSTALDCWADGYEHPAGENIRQILGGTSPPRGVVLATDDDGKTWSMVPLPDEHGVPITIVGALSCAPGACFALANDPTTPSGSPPNELVLSSQSTSSSS